MVIWDVLFRKHIIRMIKLINNHNNKKIQNNLFYEKGGFNMNRILVTIVAIFIVAALFVGCSSSSNDTTSSSTNSYVGTQTSGDFWTVSATTTGGVDTFSATDETASNTTYSGNVTPLSGNAASFSELTFTSSSDPTINANLSNYTGYAIEIPGTLLMAVPGPFKSVDNRDGYPYIASFNFPIIAITQGTCPASGGTFNWIFVPPTTWCSGDDPSGSCPSGNTKGDAFGTATITVSGSSYSMTVQPYFLNGSQDTSYTTINSMSNGTCSNGVIKGTDLNGNSLNISFSSSGLFFIDLPSGMGSIIGAQILSSDVGGFSSILQSGNTFNGFEIRSYQTVNNDTDGGSYTGSIISPVTASSTNGTTLTGISFTDLLSGTESNSITSASISYQNEVSPGLIHVPTVTSQSTQDSYIIVSQISGKYYLYGISDNWNSGNSEMTGKNFFLIQK
jgi:hypothetical protein